MVYAYERVGAIQDTLDFRVYALQTCAVRILTFRLGFYPTDRPIEQLRPSKL